MIRSLGVMAFAAGAALLLTGGANAQLNQQWVEFTYQPSKLAVSPLAISDPDTQVVFRTGDLDKDGWDDLVAVRKQQASQLGKRTSFLLMNVNGVLTDKTAQWASASTQAGDMGMLTAVNTREVQIGDINNDTWPDVVTAVSLSDGNPKIISHPRVFVNLGDDINGDWLGLRHEPARFPQLQTVGGLNVAPRFCGMGLADVTGDGFADIYYVDYDETETGIGEPSTNDLNDRLLVNNGSGFFTDESATRLTTAQLVSEFGADAQIYDVNSDGHLDLIKDTTLVSPRFVGVIYNNPANVGNFTAMGLSKPVQNGAPYGMDMGNLNNDAITDLAVADDAADKFLLGTGYDGLNQVTWSAQKLFTFNVGAGGDPGFGHNVFIRDLNMDGWNDVIITDVDGDLLGCTRRLNIYHNLGTTPGQQNLVLKEEAELASGNYGAGWKGAKGLLVADLRGSYDVGFGDWDKDSDTDIIIANCVLGAKYWQNETADGSVCQVDMGLQGPGSMEFSICGDDLTTAASVATMNLTGAAASQPVFLPVSLSFSPMPLKGGMLVGPILTLVTGLNTDGAGALTLPIAGGVNSPIHLFMQCIVKNGSVFEFSNALDVHIGF